MRERQRLPESLNDAPSACLLHKNISGRKKTRCIPHQHCRNDVRFLQEYDSVLVASRASVLIAPGDYQLAHANPEVEILLERVGPKRKPTKCEVLKPPFPSRFVRYLCPHSLH